MMYQQVLKAFIPFSILQRRNSLSHNPSLVFRQYKFMQLIE